MKTASEMVAYGAQCTWWDLKNQVGLIHSPNTKFPLPCCPHCRRMLFEMTRTEWDAAIAKYVSENDNPSYADMIFWGRGKCFSNYAELKNRWENRT